MNQWLNKIHQGNALELLKQMPDNSIDCMITSPPYWGMRSYHTEPQIWGGDSSCEHDFDINSYMNPKAPGSADNSMIGNNKKLLTKFIITSVMCKKCGAWSGELGNEPMFQMYIDHLIMIFQEVYRVLKPTGVCYVNIDDTYAGSLQGYGAKKSSKTGFQKAPVDVDYYDSSKGKPPSSEPQYHDNIRYENRDKTNEIKAKSLCLIPERFVIRMTELGFVLRNKINWVKNNAMPESAKDRFTNDSETIYFFTKKSKGYYFEQQFEPFQEDTFRRTKCRYNGAKAGTGIPGFSNQSSIKFSEKVQSGELRGRNLRTTWNISTESLHEDHYAAFPTKLVSRLIKSGCPENGIVLDIFMGSGTTGIVARKMNRNFIGCELSQKYCKLAEKRLRNEMGLFV